MADSVRSSDPLDRQATDGRLIALVDDGALPSERHAAAWVAATASPSAADWRAFLDRTLMGIGAALLISGVIYFFAFNWDELGRLSRFALLGGGVLIGAVLAARLGLDGLPGKLSLSGAAVLAGVLFAIQDQAYQVGTEWTLFALWAVLILPWVFAARFPPLWVILFVIFNVTLGLWWTTVPSERPALAIPAASFGVLNAVLLLAWELAERRWTWARSPARWVPRLLGLAVLIAVTIAVIIEMFEPTVEQLIEGGGIAESPLLGWVPTVPGGLWIAVIIGVVFVYRGFQKDLFMLAAAALSALFIVNLELGRWLFTDVINTENDVEVAASLLLVTVTLTIQAVLFAAWLRLENRRSFGSSDDAPGDDAAEEAGS